MVSLSSDYAAYRKRIRNIYETSFPITERLDFDILEHCNQEPNVCLGCILDNSTSVGMQFAIDIPNNITYLMYLAIDQAHRGQKIGSIALQNIAKLKDKIMLSIERPSDDLSQRRKEFYLRNGFYETNIFFEDTGVKYEVLMSCKGYTPTVEDLLNRYRYMTSSKLIWEKIRGTFNTEKIIFCR